MQGFETSVAPKEFAFTGNETRSLQAGRVGGGAMKCLRIQSTSTGVTHITKFALGTTLTTGTIGWAMERVVSSGSGTPTIFRLYEGSIIHVMVVYNSDGTLSVTNGPGTVVYCTSIDNMVISDWNYLELNFTISDTVGAVDLHLNGVSVCSATGLDTKNGGTGFVDNGAFVFSSNGGNPTFQYDDIYAVDGAPLGDSVVDLLLPAGAGASTGWTPSTAVANWTTVDDFSSTDYVGTPGGSGQKDLYTTTHVASGLTGTVVYATQAEALLMKSDVGTPPGPVKSALRSQGGTQTTDDLATSAVLTTTAVQYTGPVKNLDPNGDAWTLARLDAMQIGVSVP